MTSVRSQYQGLFVYGREGAGAAEEQRGRCVWFQVEVCKQGKTILRRCTAGMQLHPLLSVAWPCASCPQAVCCCCHCWVVCCFQVVGPKADKDRIPGIDVQLAEGDTWKFGEQPCSGRSSSTSLAPYPSDIQPQ